MHLGWFGIVGPISKSRRGIVLETVSYAFCLRFEAGGLRASTMNFWGAMTGFVLLVSLSGCAAQLSEIATLPVSASTPMQCTQAVLTSQNSEAFDLLYITNRTPVTSGSTLSYSAERASSLSFGSVSITPTRNSPTSKDGLRVGVITETGRFPETPYGVVATGRGLRRTPATVGT